MAKSDIQIAIEQYEAGIAAKEAEIADLRNSVKVLRDVQQSIAARKGKADPAVSEATA